ncbi:MAG: leucyl/phenylalanyl-tRNA--protein transferase [Bacteroidetes bacterium]|nr:leucyl/phenylalanyl-tRNA--protein transferase [Bacteroidota bacterium]
MPIIPVDKLLSMYASGLFPMSEGKDGPIMLFSPDPRTIIDPSSLRVTRSLRQSMRSRNFDLRFNTAFEDVIRHCADRDETWISEDIIASYIALHSLGHAHSVETWHEGRLVGGLYGVSLAGVFFGESMFTIERDASKVALVHLCARMTRCGLPLLDVQYSTPHLLRLGAYEISRAEYLHKLDAALRLPVSFLG